MGERLLIVAGVAIASFVLYRLFVWAQRRRATAALRQSVEEISTHGHARVLYFRSDSCASCRTQARLFEHIDEDLQARIEMVDVDREPERARAYGILTLPTTFVVDAYGEVVHANYGVVQPHKLRGQLADAGYAAS